MTTPSYVVQFRGFPACRCLATWLPVYEATLQVKGILDGPLRIYQLIGGAAASANTHSKGGAFDLLDLPGEEDLVIGRQMGADAYWTRPDNWNGTGGIRHNHGVLTGCPHNTPARYQITAVRAGFNGLGTGGRGGADTGPRPLSGRTWRQGIQWALTQGDIMAQLDEKDLRTLVREEAKAGALEAIEEALTVRQGNDLTRDTNIRRGGDTKALAKDLIDELADAGVIDRKD